MTPARPAFRILLLVGALVGACAHQNSSAPAPPPSSESRLLDEPLPAFQRPTLQGGTFSSSAAAGHLLVVDFFAAYCRPCQRKLPVLEALHRRQPDVSIVGISLDDSGDAARKSMTRHHLTFPVVHDSGNVLAGRLRVTELPVSFIVDGHGRIRWVGGPDQPDEALERAVAALAAAPN